MYPLKRLRQIRELSLLLYGGVPEIPKPIYETDSQGFSEERTAYRRSATFRSLPPADAGQVVGSAHYDRETNSLTISLSLEGGSGPRRTLPD
jgi:hypothetical protein